MLIDIIFVVDEESGVTEERRKKIAVFLPRFKELVETLKRIHVAVFYFTGKSIWLFFLCCFNYLFIKYAQNMINYSNH